MSLRPSALVKKIVAPAVPLSDLRGRTGPLFSNRMIEVKYRPDEGGWLPPVLRDYGPLELAPQISGIHYGLLVFDHCVVTRHHETGQPQIFRPDFFLDRLARSRDYLHFAKYDNADLLELVKTLVRHDPESVPTAPGQSLLVRVNIIGDNKNLSAGPADAFRLFMFGAPFDATSPASSSPWKLKADPTVRRSWAGGTGDVSVGGNYANQIYHESVARRQGGFDRLLWLVDNGAITTAGDANFFAVFKSGSAGYELVTPELNQYFQPGVMRQSVIDIVKASKNGSVKEAPLTIDELSKAVKAGVVLEAFATSSTSLVRPICSIMHNDECFPIPTSPDGVAADLKRGLLSLLNGSADLPTLGGRPLSVAI